jgi:hypothetical protein
MKYLGILAQKEVYGFFSALCNLPRPVMANDEFNDGPNQVIIPDLVIRFADSLEAQMYELKRIHGVYTASTNGTQSSTPTPLYTIGTQSQNPKRAAEKRQAAIPGEYANKVKKAQENYTGDDQQIITSFEQIPEVIGLAVGAFGELSSNFDVLIKKLAEEGAVKSYEKFGAASPQAARGTIAWHLKKRWCRLAVISEVQCRFSGLSYAGTTTAQAQAATIHTQQQQQQQPLAAAAHTGHSVFGGLLVS